MRCSRIVLGPAPGADREMSRVKRTADGFDRDDQQTTMASVPLRRFRENPK